MDEAASPAAGSSSSGAAVAAVCALATVAGYGIADITSGDLRAGIDGFAAGALLVMLIDSMIPDATRKSGRVAGLVDHPRLRGRDGALEPRLIGSIPRELDE